MVHWAQGVRRKIESKPKFSRYDYGQRCEDPFGSAQLCNQNMYGSLEPPIYDLKSIQTPLAIFSGNGVLPWEQVQSNQLSTFETCMAAQFIMAFCKRHNFHVQGH